MKKRLVIITDCTDIASSEIRATIIKFLGNEVNNIEIEPIVNVTPFSITNGSFVLRLMTECYPEGTIFSIVLNPLKERTERIMIKTKKKDFTVFTTNTGVLGWLINDFGCDVAYEINDPGFMPFGGKYIHAPAVGKYLSGIPIEEIAKPFDVDRIRKLQIEEGTIVHIDNFGLIKIFYDPNKLNMDHNYIVELNNNKLEMQFSKRLMSLEDGTWAIFPGSSIGLLELGCARVNGAIKLKAKVGDKISITKKF